ncbi:thioredoxin [Capsaspora owczarzaki ATCC 30864]|uniref:Thioredoxin n=1 Tax=Capsaspora owczarzaki (strain ATCC 30864) TaxID=595528 RepID=A0A0D2U9W5_CAPO3|nr:thioredoxin [Capsaspora owczarzaki ATCC 30864]KJE91856.1 thioredoxin [Capsaspora owczarzaki ATCC 30864]|eukprot:XP_004363764.1 thioredoxin [Capsaspora owczarzaki ATCC 30864]
MSTIHVTSKAEFDTHINGDKLVIVDFYATWCGPCKMIAPQIEKLAAENTGITFLKVDVDELEDVAASCSISAMPTFQAFRKGSKVGEVIGANVKAVIELLSK